MPGLYDLFGPWVPRPAVLARDPAVTLAVADTYAALASCCNEHGAGSPSIERIRDRCYRRSRRQVQRHLELLEVLGYVRRTVVTGRPTRYQLVRLTYDQAELEGVDPRRIGDTTDPRRIGGMGKGDRPVTRIRREPASPIRPTSRDFQ